MDLYLDILNRLPAFEELKNSIINRTTPVSLSGASGVLSSHFIYGLSVSFKKPVLVACSDEGVADRLCDDVNNMAGRDCGAVFPAKELGLRGAEASSTEFEQKRLNVLTSLLRGELRVVFASAEALMQYTIPPGELKQRSTVICEGQNLDIAETLNILSAAGYVRRDMVDGAGQFSSRGGIVDFFPIGTQSPVRAEFWGDTVDTLSNFDTASQRRIQQIREISISPASEILFDSPSVLSKKLQALIGDQNNPYPTDSENINLESPAYAGIVQDASKLSDGLELGSADRYIRLAYKKPSLLTDYMPDSIIVVNEPADVTENARAVFKLHCEDIKQLLEEKALHPDLCGFMQSSEEFILKIKEHPAVCFSAFPRINPEIKPKTMLSISATQNSGWNGDIKLLTEDLNNLISAKYTCIVLAGTKKGTDALIYDLHVNGIEAIDGNILTGNLQPGKTYVFCGALSGGFEYPELKLNLFTRIARTLNVRRRRKVKAREIINYLSDLDIGDYVVHISHGIGIFNGIHQLTLDGVTKDYIKVKYQGSDILYVPVTQLDLITKYIGPKDGGAAPLNKLNSAGWQKTRTRVKAAVAEMADELMKLYAARANTKGFAFSGDNDWQKQFELRFEYEETDDQLKCTEEIKTDMQKNIPMERLLCGDVGFGKTEVALRAAFKCVLDSKQCAILCPTTILAWQHYQTIMRRIGNFPVKVELLSRFRTQKQQREIIRALAEGNIDIIVGTHRLVQQDVQFKDLGLAVIDEEQRFGVAHKEKFKQMFLGIDVLILTATPIPRTLNMAMSGIRDMSLIEDPPLDRYPVQTYVIEHDPTVVHDAIRRELRRGGQVYYIHNRVDTIENAAFRLSEKLPEARIGVAHGKMRENELSRIWQDLLENKIDVLVCTTIIETGVDVANCNTLIIENADTLGLSQLHQLRGRVGRSPRRAFAYFTFPPMKQLTEIASKRLTAIREFTKFGSGFHIAMRDLEIRGAGNILGARQHGHMEAVGYDMYIRLLAEAIEERSSSGKKQGFSAGSQVECLVDLNIDAHIPNDYIQNLSQRMEIYRKIANVACAEDASDIFDELNDRFGKPPEGVKGLVDIALLRHMASVKGIREVSVRSSRLVLFMSLLDTDLINNLVGTMKGRILVSAGNKPHISVKLDKNQPPLEALKETLEFMNSFA
ncbi:MAG: transcription-repair coupling factor [Oscillospiraceae bacterium]|nr:transcription-repair coupling factor [Oscillospiraceae bacterium]